MDDIINHNARPIMNIPTPTASRVSPTTRTRDMTPTSTAALDIRRATDADWPQMWPIFHQVTAAADTFVYDSDTDEATARSRWLGAGGPRCKVAVWRSQVV